MADSFQNEVPRARINLSLDVETGGAKKKLELPLKMMVMGDFSNGKTKGRVADRKPIPITKNNLESVMKELAPSLRFTVPNRMADDGSEIPVDLSFDSLKSFHPEAVARQVPELHSLMAMRNLLKDLKSNLLDNSKFRKELEAIVNSRPELEGLRQQLESLLDAKAGQEADETVETP